MKIATAKTTLMCIALLGFGVVQSVAATEIDDLTSMVQGFLANADKEAVHASFWAEDLVYTSSAGLRFGKSDIMNGFSVTDEPDTASEDEPSIVYSGEDIDVRVYGDMAVVAFKLLGTPDDCSDVLSYFNTGTFLKRDGVWRVVAWQATKIP